MANTPRAKRNAGKSQNQLFNEKADRDAAALRAMALPRAAKAMTTEDISLPAPKRPTIPTRASTQSQPYALAQDEYTRPQDQSPPPPTLCPLLAGSFGESQAQPDYRSTLDDLSSQDPVDYALDDEYGRDGEDGRDGEEGEGRDGEEGIGETQVDGTQKRVQRSKFPWDKERRLELVGLKMYSDFICMNRHRAGGLRSDEKTAIVTAIMKAARQMYPTQADQLALVFSQVKTKFDWYQRKTTAIERLLEVSGFGMDWKVGVVSAANATWTKYLSMDSHKEARWLRDNPLPGIEWCRNIWGTKTATGEHAMGGAMAAMGSAKAKQSTKRKRTGEHPDERAHTVSVAPECEQTEPIEPVDEEEEADDPDTPGPSSARHGVRTRRAAATPVLTKKDTKPVSGAAVLGEKMHAAFKLLADAKMEPERVLTQARSLMWEFHGSRVHQQACLRTFNEQPWCVAAYVEGNFEYRLRFMATIQSDNNTDDTFDRDVARIDLLRGQRQKQLARIARAEAAGRRHFITLIPHDRVKDVDLDATRPHKIRLSDSDEEDTDEEEQRRSAAAPEILRHLI